ncbi:hypothetical protein AMJ83_01840 [candidate division WOR_3 bacterium SM23_42]|uniref:Uncharacterized protein n=1 Tax=candidate division WOR_3 bacterium SM23_42 TaxID=1703779 RepID=A0A0S8FVA5_UNCW3|nr:MAG: hypothetical protein AMJ83_01840 [candidate division WOR_3 bacterium SM23_42]
MPQILDRLGEWKDDPDAHVAVERFAEWFDDSFTAAINKSRIENIMGKGPVPDYAPPALPVGGCRGRQYPTDTRLLCGTEILENQLII